MGDTDLTPQNSRGKLLLLPLALLGGLLIGAIGVWLFLSQTAPPSGEVAEGASSAVDRSPVSEATVPAPSPLVSEPEAPQAGGWQQAGQHGNWVLRCQRPPLPAVCQVVQALTFEDQSGTTHTLELLFQPNPLGTLDMVVGVPLGLDLQAGIALRADEAEQVPLLYTTCTPEICQAQGLLNTEQANPLEQGETLRLGFLPYGTQQTLVVEIPLEGFSQAIEAARAPH